MIDLGSPIRGPRPVPALDIPASDLLLDANSFPPRWEVFPCAPHCDQAEGSATAIRSFGIPEVPGHVVQEVFHFEDQEAAHIEFQTYMQSNLSTSAPEARSPYVPFQPPSEISYRSAMADEQYLGCGVDVVPGCRAGRRYGEYFVYFYFDIDGGKGDGLRISDVEPILRAIDEKYSALFELSSSVDNP